MRIADGVIQIIAKIRSGHSWCVSQPRKFATLVFHARVANFTGWAKKFNFAGCVDDNDSVHRSMLHRVHDHVAHESTRRCRFLLRNHLAVRLLCRPDGLWPGRQLRTGCLWLVVRRLRRV